MFHISRQVSFLLAICLSILGSYGQSSNDAEVERYSQEAQKALAEARYADAEQAFEFLDVLGADLKHVLHGEQRFNYHAPVMVGDTLRFEPRIAGITDKKGGAMTLAVVETTVTNQHGVHVADCSRTVVVLNKVAA